MTEPFRATTHVPSSSMRFRLFWACLILLVSADTAIARQKGPLFTPIFPLQANRVSVSLDGRVLGPGVTMSITPQGGGTALYTGLTTDGVYELSLVPGAYALMVGATSVPFIVNSITPTAQNPQCTGDMVLAP